jgi:hypothetical protein
VAILKAKVASDDGKIYTIDAIKHEGGVWLVPAWRDDIATKSTKPARIIRVDCIPHQEAAGGDWIVNLPIPKAVLDGATLPEESHGFEVIDRPDITFPLGPLN